jgi:uncharacterized membrane protein
MTIPAFLSTEPRPGRNEASLHRRLIEAQRALREIHRIARDTSIGSPKDRLDRIVSEAQLAVLRRPACRKCLADSIRQA